MEAMEKARLGGVRGGKGFEYYYIHIVATAPDEQGHGYGKKLMNSVLAEVSSFYSNQRITLIDSMSLG